MNFGLTLIQFQKIISDKLNTSNKTSQLGGYWSVTKGRDIALRHIVQLKSAHVEREHMDACRDLIIYLVQVFYETEEDKEDEEGAEVDDEWKFQEIRCNLYCTSSVVLICLLML